MTADLYARITTELSGWIEDCFDTKLPDEGTGSAWRLTQPVIVVYGISDVPTAAVDGTICLREQRVTCEIQALDLPAARAIKESLIAALQGWRGTLISLCEFEISGPEIYDWDLNPPRYCLPVDFMVTF